jgi:hypothetical protein
VLGYFFEQYGGYHPITKELRPFKAVSPRLYIHLDNIELAVADRQVSRDDFAPKLFTDEQVFLHFVQSLAEYCGNFILSRPWEEALRELCGAHLKHKTLFPIELGHHLLRQGHPQFEALAQCPDDQTLEAEVG